MRVALLRVFPEEGWTSIEVYADRLTQALRALDADLDLVVVQPHAWRWDWLKHWLPSRSRRWHALNLYLSRWVRYPWALRRVKAGVYHILDNSYGHLAFFTPRQRTVVTSHGGTPRTWRQWSHAGPALWVFGLAFRGALRAARVVSVSEYARQELLAESNYPAEHIRVVHHGLDADFRPPFDVAALRQHLQGDRACQLVLHVGHSAARKNVEALYRAIALLRAGGLAVRLVRAGREPTPAQEQLITQLGLREDVVHLGPIAHCELPAYYAAADAFCFPSLYEGFGIPLIEAMACGAPVVCSDLPVFHEVCGDAALYSDAADPAALAAAIRQVLANPARAANLRARGLERAQQFTWRRTAEETYAVYRELCGPHEGAR